MKNLAKFLLFVLLISAGISLLYDYRLKHGGLNLPSRRTPEKYTLASKPNVDSKDIASLEGSQLSIMPIGFEATPAQDLKNLLEYLAQSHQ